LCWAHDERLRPIYGENAWQHDYYTITLADCCAEIGEGSHAARTAVEQKLSDPASAGVNGSRVALGGPTEIPPVRTLQCVDEGPWRPLVPAIPANAFLCWPGPERDRFPGVRDDGAHSENFVSGARRSYARSPGRSRLRGPWRASVGHCAARDCEGGCSVAARAPDGGHQRYNSRDAAGRPHRGAHRISDRRREVDDTALVCDRGLTDVAAILRRRERAREIL